MFTPEMWVLISFLCFIGFFGRKIYLKIVEQIDEYIKGISEKIAEAEKIKEEASVLLKEACLRRDKQQEEVDRYKRESEQKLKILDESNRRYMDALTKNFQQSFDKKVEADIAKKIEETKNRIIEQVVFDVEKKILEDKPKIRVLEDDLKQL